MVESCLGWFGYLWRRPVEAPIRRVDQMEASPIPRGGETKKNHRGNDKERLRNEHTNFSCDMLSLIFPYHLKLINVLTLVEY
ncbi:hypothetical protein Lal_00016681 [Lupinus albus]|nr:hypothetical protein Lal_00016681 [Lupinus albus]